MVVVGAATIGVHAFAVIRKKTTLNRMTKNVENCLSIKFVSVRRSHD